MFISFSLFAKQRERNEPKKEKARKRSLHFADAQCRNVFELFKLKFFQGSLSHCVHVRLTHLTMSNRMQFCVCVSTIAKHERFRLRSKRNEHPFAQSDAVGSAECYRVFFSFGSFSLLGCSRFTSSRALPAGNTLHSTLTIRFFLRK